MSRIGKSFSLAYGLICYAIFLWTFLYLIGWLTNLGVPVSIDAGRAGPPLVALAVDVALIALFGLQHSVMARPAVKRAITRVLPEPLERSSYVLASSAVLLFSFVAWQPLPFAIWQTEGALAALLQAGAFAGFGIVFVSTLLIDHFDLFGLRQVFLAWRGHPYTGKSFVTPAFYRFVRHPLYVGFLLAFWSAPTLSVGRALFASGMTVYILIAVRYEERDLAAVLGEPYQRWRATTPMLVPRLRRRRN